MLTLRNLHMHKHKPPISTYCVVSKCSGGIAETHLCVSAITLLTHIHALAKLSQQSISGNPRRRMHASPKTSFPFFLNTDSAGGGERGTLYNSQKLHCLEYSFKERTWYLLLPGLLHGQPHDDQGVVRKHNINAADTVRLL